MNLGDPANPSRRQLVSLAGAAGAAVALGGAWSPRTRAADPGPQPAAPPLATRNASDIIVDTLIRWQVSAVFGLVGDGINPLIEALRKRQSEIRFIAVRHEEAAAFMACGHAKHTGKLGVCIATTGPGAVHLMNGLYDAKMDSAPVLAITGTTFHDLIGTRFMQSVNTVALMQDVSVYNTQITGPLNAEIVTNIACRAALGLRGVAHVTIAKDTQAMALPADKPSTENHGLRTSASFEPSQEAPSGARLNEAAAILNSGRRVAILAGQGALGARREVTECADRLAAPVAKALLGKGVLPDDSPFTTGGIGHLGTLPSQYIMQTCDTVLILGSTMPWVDAYPKPGSARGIQVDIKPQHIGLRYPVELGLCGDMKSTLSQLLPLLKHKRDRGFLAEAQSRMADWNALLDRVAATARAPLRPQMVIRRLSDRLADDAVICLDCGANTHFAARMLRIRENQQLVGTGMLATMAPALPFAIAGQLAFPKRQVVAIAGDGGFSQLMVELATAVKYELPIKVLVLKNNSLAEVLFEQKELGNPVYGCDLTPIDFAAFARACGADGYTAASVEELDAVLDAFLRANRTAVLEVVVDPNEKPALAQELT